MKFTFLILLSVLVYNTLNAQKISADTTASTIYWKGTKMRRIGKHEGTIKLSSGHFIIRDQKVTGGTFIINMHSISVTDIPEHEPEPRNNLTNHLKSDDFFATQRFPYATFKILEIKESSEGRHIANGELTMRGITKKISFEADIRLSESKIVYVSASIELDRQKWNISFKGLKDMVVDDTIYIRLNIVSIRAD